MKTIAIIGAGPGMGLALAKRFGAEGFRVALNEMKRDFGHIDVLEFSPYAGFETFVPALQVRPEDAEAHVRSHVLPAILAVNELLPEMQARKSGAFLFTTGFSAMVPIPMVGNAGIAMAGLRNYITDLHHELKAQGIYVGHLSVGTLIAPGTEGDPATIAEAWYEMYAQQEAFEAVFPAGIASLQL